MECLFVFRIWAAFPQDQHILFLIEELYLCCFYSYSLYAWLTFYTLLWKGNVGPESELGAFSSSSSTVIDYTVFKTVTSFKTRRAGQMIAPRPVEYASLNCRRREIKIVFSADMYSNMSNNKSNTMSNNMSNKVFVHRKQGRRTMPRSSVEMLRTCRERQRRWSRFA